MNLNPGQLPTYESLFPVLRTQTTCLALWYKRLERGCFILPDQWSKDGHIERRDLSMLLEGIVPKRIEKRYARTNLSCEKSV